MTRTQIMETLKADSNLGNLGEWQERHNGAIDAPKAGLERALVTLVAGWVEYAKAHREAHESPIGEDGVLGDGMEEIGRGILTLLDGSSGRLDCGTFDALIRRTAKAEGMEGFE